MDRQERSASGRYRSDLRNVIGSSASAYGYTLTMWSTGSVLSHAYGPPSPPLVFSFFLGAVAAFAVVGMLAFGGVTVEFGVEARHIQVLKPPGIIARYDPTCHARIGRCVM